MEASHGPTSMVYSTWTRPPQPDVKADISALYSSPQGPKYTRCRGISGPPLRGGCVSGLPLESERGAFQRVPRCVSGRAPVRFPPAISAQRLHVERSQNPICVERRQNWISRQRGASRQSDSTALLRGASSESNLPRDLLRGASSESDLPTASRVERAEKLMSRRRCRVECPRIRFPDGAPAWSVLRIRSPDSAPE